MELTPYEEGKAAAERMESFPDYCPYSFQRANVSVEEFNCHWRKKMDEWFRGWREHLEAHGIGLNMKPRKLTET